MDTIGAFILPAAAASKAGLAIREPVRARRLSAYSPARAKQRI